MSVGLLSAGQVARATVSGPIASYDYVRQFLLAALCLIWMWPGILNRSPWKPVETTLVQVIQESSQHGHLFNPTLLGKPYVNQPPLYLASAGVSARLFTGALSPHEAMRLVNFLWLGLGLALSALAAGWGHGSRVRWTAVLLITGSPLLLITARTVNPHVSLIAISAAGLIGMYLLDSKKNWGLLVLGLTATIGFWCVGNLAPLYVVSLVALAPMIRNRKLNINSLIAIAIVLAASSLSYAWWQYYMGDAAQINLASSASLFATIQELLLVSVWALWPSLPFASIAYVRWRYRSLHNAQIQLGLLGVIAGCLAILLTGISSDSTVIILLPAVAIMAAGNMTNLANEVSKVMDWFAMLVLGVGLLGFFWLTWLAFQLGQPASLLSWLTEQGINEVGTGWQVVLAMFATIACLIVMLRMGRSSQRVVINWMTGITVSWLVFCLLWIPGVDQAKSYAAIANEINHELTILQADCLDGNQANAVVVAQLVYYGNTQLLAEEQCRWALADPGRFPYEPIWQGGRPGEHAADMLAIYELP